MELKFNGITGKLDLVGITESELALFLKLDQTTPQTTVGGIPISAQASAPASPIDGLMYLNTTDHKVYIYYGFSWQVLHTLSYTPPVIGAGEPMGLLIALTYS